MSSSLSWLARIGCALTLLLALGTNAFAGGRTFNLSTLVKRGGVTLRPGERLITIRAPKSVLLQRTYTAGFAPIFRKPNKAGTATLYRLIQGSYQTRGAPEKRFVILPEGNTATAPK